MKTKILFNLTILSFAACFATGCAVTLHHGQFAGAQSPSKGQMALSSRAQNMESRIGWGTFTAFAIPIAPVNVHGEADREVMNQVKEAVEHCGYEVKVVEQPGEAAGLPLLTCNVQEF